MTQRLKAAARIAVPPPGVIAGRRRPVVGSARQCGRGVGVLPRALLLAVVFLTGSGWAKPTRKSPAQPDGGERPGGPECSVVAGVVEVLELLEAEELLPGRDVEARRSIVRAILTALNCGGQLMVAPGLPGDGTAQVELPVVGHRATVGGSFLYVQVFSVSDEGVRALAEALADADHGHHEGFVVDLRYARGGSVQAAGAAAKRLAQTKLPVAFLTNGQTSGAAEVLVALAKRGTHAVVVGQPTRGLPFAWCRKALACGDALLLPAPDSNGTDAVAAKPHPPDVLVEQKLALDDLRRSKPGEGETSDLVLRRAVDLLKTIMALGDKHF